MSELNNKLVVPKKILSENEFFNDLDNIMTDDKFRTFYNKYFKNFNDIKTVLLYMKLYETIQIEYKEQNNCDIDNELLAYMISELMNNSDTRKMIINSFNNFTDLNINENRSKRFLLDIFENSNKIKNII
jgi:hypothetical protein